MPWLPEDKHAISPVEQFFIGPERINGFRAEQLFNWLVLFKEAPSVIEAAVTQQRVHNRIMGGYGKAYALSSN